MFFTVSWKDFKAHFFPILKFAFGYGVNFLKDNNLTIEIKDSSEITVINIICNIFLFS